MDNNKEDLFKNLLKRKLGSHYNDIYNLILNELPLLQQHKLVDPKYKEIFESVYMNLVYEIAYCTYAKIDFKDMIRIINTSRQDEMYSENYISNVLKTHKNSISYIVKLLDSLPNVN